MKAHPHFDRSRIPRFMLQAALRVERGLQRIARRVERGAERIADDLEDVTVVRLDRFAQNRVMTGEECRQLTGKLLRQRRAALDVREEKCDGSRGEMIDGLTPKRI
jgi:hypothetical protein